MTGTKKRQAAYWKNYTKMSSWDEVYRVALSKFIDYALIRIDRPVGEPVSIDQVALWKEPEGFLTGPDGFLHFDHVGASIYFEKLLVDRDVKGMHEFVDRHVVGEWRNAWAMWVARSALVLLRKMKADFNYRVDALSADKNTVVESSDVDLQEQEPVQDLKARHAAYMAKSRKKAKAMRRPEHRDVEKAYMSVVEGRGLYDIIEQIDMNWTPKSSVAAADAQHKSKVMLSVIRNLVVHELTVNKGFDEEQSRERLEGMVANKRTLDEPA